MERFGIESPERLKATWTKAGLYLAMDAAFWNSPKETKDYAKHTPHSLQGASTDTFFASLGFPV